MNAFRLLQVLALAISSSTSNAFTTTTHAFTATWRQPRAWLQNGGQTIVLNNDNSIDVSHLGLTMDDLNAPLPPGAFELQKSGSESTSRIADDGGCEWTEHADDVEAVLRIAALRGQPAACLAVTFAKTTATVTAFGYTVWSCVLRGTCVPLSGTFNVVDGADMVPVIQVTVAKESPEDQWGGLIAQIGENSLSDL